MYLYICIMCAGRLESWSKSAPIYYKGRNLIEGVGCFYRKSSTLWLFIFFQKEVKQVFEKYTFAHTIVLSGSCFLHYNGLRIKVVKTWIIITIISSTETWVFIKRISHAKSDQTWAEFKVNFIVIKILVQIESHIIPEGLITTIL